MEHSDIEHMAQGYPPAHIGKDSEEVIVWLATQLLATQQQRDALAADREKFAVQCAAAKMAVQYAQAAGFECTLNTPATDDYLNSVRAGALEDAAKRLFGQGYTFEVLTRFAAQLRAGKDGE